MKNYLHWAARILGILFALFLSLFAFDVFEGQASIWEQILGFLIHLTPVYVLIIGVILGWKRPWIGGAIFLGFGLYFMVSARGDLLSFLLVGGIPVLIGLLFLADWWLGRKSAP